MTVEQPQSPPEKVNKPKEAVPSAEILSPENIKKKIEGAKGRATGAVQRLNEAVINPTLSDECNRKSQSLHELAKCKLEAVLKIIEKLECDSEAGKKVAAMAERICELKRYKPEYCWEWIMYVYRKAGTKWNVKHCDIPYRGKDCGKHHASPETMATITPGDIIFYNNKNDSDKYGNHSVIFVEWINQENRIARVASGYKDHEGRIHQADLKKNPVTYIAKPEFRSKKRLAEKVAAALTKINHELNGFDELISQMNEQQQLAVLEQKIA